MERVKPENGLPRWRSLHPWRCSRNNLVACSSWQGDLSNDSVWWGNLASGASPRVDQFNLEKNTVLLPSCWQFWMTVSMGSDASWFVEMHPSTECDLLGAVCATVDWVKGSLFWMFHPMLVWHRSTWVRSLLPSFTMIGDWNIPLITWVSLFCWQKAQSVKHTNTWRKHSFRSLDGTSTKAFHPRTGLPLLSSPVSYS